MTHTGRRRRQPKVTMAALIEQLFGVVGAAGGEVWQERPLLPEEHSVWVMQKRLEALGLWPAAAPLDGRPSETTREALRRFQRLAGLRPDGDVHDARTRLVLRDQVRAAAQAGRIPPTP